MYLYMNLQMYGQIKYSNKNLHWACAGAHIRKWWVVFLKSDRTRKRPKNLNQHRNLCEHWLNTSAITATQSHIESVFYSSLFICNLAYMVSSLSIPPSGSLHVGNSLFLSSVCITSITHTVCFLWIFVQFCVCLIVRKCVLYLVTWCKLESKPNGERHTTMMNNM